MAFVGIGSNQGDRMVYLAAAARLLCGNESVHELVSSPVYETMPVGEAGPGNFLNAVLRLTVSHEPLSLLVSLRAIERALGRSPDRSGPRTIDLDLLFYDDLILAGKTLTLPHPRLTERAFVLVPLADLAPDHRHPATGLSVTEMLKDLADTAEIVARVADEIASEPT